MRRLALYLTCIPLLAACAGIVADGDRAVKVLTAGSEYALPAGGGAVQVPFNVSNGREDAVLVARCVERIAAVLERKEGDAWIEVGGGACPAHLPTVPLTLRPTSLVQDELSLDAPGVYRIHVWCREPGNEGELAAYSNDFTVRGSDSIEGD